MRVFTPETLLVIVTACIALPLLFEIGTTIWLGGDASPSSGSVKAPPAAKVAGARVVERAKHTMLPDLPEGSIEVVHPEHADIYVWIVPERKKPEVR